MLGFVLFFLESQSTPVSTCSPGDASLVESVVSLEEIVANHVYRAQK